MLIVIYPNAPVDDKLIFPSSCMIWMVTALSRGKSNLLQNEKLSVVQLRSWDLCFSGTRSDLSCLPGIGIAFYGAGIMNDPQELSDIRSGWSPMEQRPSLKLAICA